MKQLEQQAYGHAQSPSDSRAGVETRFAEGKPRPDIAPESGNWSSLMALAQGGDQTAYTQLLRQLLPYLWSLAASSCRSRDEIEDCVQDILLTIHAIRRTYDPRRPFGPWLLTIARRRIIDRSRREGRIARREVPLGATHDTLSTAAVNLHEGAVVPSALRRAIAALPTSQRRAVELLKLRELSLREASVESGMTVSALKAASHRALWALRGMFDEK